MGLFDFFKKKQPNNQQQYSEAREGSIFILNKATKANKKFIEDYKDGNGKLASSAQENTFHTSELVFSCVDYISKAASQAVPKLYEVKNGERKPVKDKKLQNWILQPNPFWSWGSIIELATQGLLLSGVAPLTFEINKGEYETWFLTPPSNVTVVPDKSNYIKGFIYNDAIAYKADELIWIINPTLNNAYYGLPSVATLLDTLELEADAIEELKNFYEGSNIISGILKAEYPLTPEQIEELRKQFNALYGKDGSARRGTAILPAKMDYKPIQATPKDAMLLDSLNISEKRVLRVFKLNALVLGGESNSAGKPQELMKVVFNTAVRPYLYKIADQITVFLRNKFKKPYLFEFDFDRITELDTPLDVKADSAKTLLATGIASLNEAREMVNLDKLNFEGANKNLIPAFLAGSDAKFFQDIVSSDKTDSQSQSTQNSTKPVGSTDPTGGKPDLKV
jgi:HK97 family phage portal protein